MNNQVESYIEYLGKMQQVTKPKMPEFDDKAYTENEYVKAIQTIEEDFKNTDCLDLTISYLKGE